MPDNTTGKWQDQDSNSNVSLQNRFALTKEIAYKTGSVQSGETRGQ